MAAGSPPKKRERKSVKSPSFDGSIISDEEKAQPSPIRQSFSRDSDNALSGKLAESDNFAIPATNDHDSKKDHRSMMAKLNCLGSIRFVVLIILCLQNSLFTLLRRYSQGILREEYSKYECLMAGEIIKIFYSAWMIAIQMKEANTGGPASGGGVGQQKADTSSINVRARLRYLVMTSKKMVVLALIYGAMNILSFVSLRNIGAGMFTIFAQCKIMTTASFSALILRRRYSWTQWRALISLMLGVLLFSEPIWGNPENLYSKKDGASPFIGTMAVLIEVTLSGFASIYFEKVIKQDPLQLTIWERNFQLALSSFPVYVLFIIADGGGPAGFGGGWSLLATFVALLGAAGGLLVALSIKYGDSILKTLATTGAIVLSSILDWMFLGGPLTPSMAIAGCQVIISICNYTFDTSPPIPDGAPPPVEEKVPLSPRPNNDDEKDIEMTPDEYDDEEKNTETVPLKR